MINDTLNQLVANAKSVMYENTLLFRCEGSWNSRKNKSRMVQTLRSLRDNVYDGFEAIEAIKDYSDAVNNN